MNVSSDTFMSQELIFIYLYMLLLFLNPSLFLNYFKWFLKLCVIIIIIIIIITQNCVIVIVLLFIVFIYPSD